MTVTINLVYILGLMLYSLAVTGFWVCSVIGAGKDAQDRILELQCANDGCRIASSKASALESENEKLRGEKRHLLEQYIKIQNEYGWFRNMIRAADPGAYSQAQRQIQAQKEKGNGQDK